MKKSMGKKSSAPQNTATGSGSKPSGGKFPLASSAPADKKGLSRKPPGALK